MRGPGILALPLVTMACGPAVPARTAAPSAAAERVIVQRIVDGDTIVVRTAAAAKVKVRLLEIDTPEHGRFYAAEATSRTAELLPAGSTATVRSDREQYDRYGRALYYVWNSQGVWVNKDLVAQGFARVMLVPPNDAHIAEMRAAEAAARRERLGVWTDPEHAYTHRQLSAS